MINNSTIETVACIIAMHLQEKTTARCINYFEKSNAVDEACRTAMVSWLCQITDALSLNRDTVGLAMSLLDRFLSTSTESGEKVLSDKQQFQLAAITCYFIAVKINEPVQLGMDLLVQMCRGCYEKSEITSMEQDILFSLEWRISAPTPLDFMRHILALLPSIDECIIDSAEQLMANANKHLIISTCAPSAAACACIGLSFREADICMSPDQELFWNEICRVIELDASDLLGIQQQLGVSSPHSKSFRDNAGPTITRTLSRGSSQGSYVSSGQSASPVAINVASL